MTGHVSPNHQLDVDDPELVIELAHDAGQEGDEPRLIELFEAASERLSKQSIANVLTATHWRGQVTLHRMLGWKVFQPSPALTKRRAEYFQLASRWLSDNYPDERKALLDGLEGES